MAALECLGQGCLGNCVYLFDLISTAGQGQGCTLPATLCRSLEGSLFARRDSQKWDLESVFICTGIKSHCWHVDKGTTVVRWEDFSVNTNTHYMQHPLHTNNILKCTKDCVSCSGEACSEQIMLGSMFIFLYFLKYKNFTAGTIILPCTAHSVCRLAHTVSPSQNQCATVKSAQRKTVMGNDKRPGLIFILQRSWKAFRWEKRALCFEAFRNVSMPFRTGSHCMT